MRFWLEKNTIRGFKRQLINMLKFQKGEDTEEGPHNIRMNLLTLKNPNDNQYMETLNLFKFNLKFTI